MQEIRPMEALELTLEALANSEAILRNRAENSSNGITPAEGIMEKSIKFRKMHDALARRSARMTLPRAGRVTVDFFGPELFKGE